jgi:hypothetical protein
MIAVEDIFQYSHTFYIVLVDKFNGFLGEEA